MTPLLEVHHLRVTYRKTTVLDVDHLTLEPGEVLAVIGPNGAGKSTLLRVLAALERPAQGQLRYRGIPLDWKNTLTYRRRNAVVLQEPLLLDMSVYANVALGLNLRGRRGAQVREKVENWLNRFRVLHLAHQSALTLSGGEARRVALARAFVLDPDILFLDEPFSGLDVLAREDILSDLRRVLRETNTTGFLVTHDRDEALALGDRVVVLMQGRVRQIGTPREVFTRPVDREVAQFVGVENILAGRVTGESATGVRVHIAASLTLNVAQSWSQPPEVWACIRPEHIHLGNPEFARPGATTFDARVEEVIPLGSRVKVVLRVDEVVLTSVLGYAHWANMGLGEGEKVVATISPSDVHLIAR